MTNPVAEGPLVEVDEVDYVRGETQILKDVNLTINPGEHWVLLGPNGAGKSSLARLIAGRTYPTEGEVEVFGEPTTDVESDYLASRIGVGSQDVRDRLAEADTVLSLVLASAWGQVASFDEEYEDEDTARAMDLLTALGVGALAERPFGTLSEGEKQRVSIARALMIDPELLILDEPTAGLDLGARETLVGALQEIMADKASPSVVLITHEIEEIAPGFTNVALLSGGEVLEAGPLEEVLTGENLTRAFGLPLNVVEQRGRYWAYSEQG